MCQCLLLCKPCDAIVSEQTLDSGLGYRPRLTASVGSELDMADSPAREKLRAVKRRTAVESIAISSTRSIGCYNTVDFEW